MRWSFGILLGIAGLLAVACAPGRSPVATQLSAERPQVAPVEAIVMPGEAGAPATLQFSIRWPMPYEVALLPYSSTALRLRVASDSAVLGERWIIKEPGVSYATASMAIDALRAGTVRVEAEVYRQASPDLAVDLPLATGLAASVAIRSSQFTPVALRLVPTLRPTVASFSTRVGASDSVIDVLGSNFGNGLIPVTVGFNGAAVPSQLVSRLSESLLRVRVPAGAYSGPVMVTADGVEGSSSIPFWVVASMSVASPKYYMDISPPDTRVMFYNMTWDFQGVPNWSFRPGESELTWGATPDLVVDFALSNSEAGTLTRLSNTTVRFNAGGLTRSADLSMSFGTTSGLLKVGVIDPKLFQ